MSIGGENMNVSQTTFSRAKAEKMADQLIKSGAKEVYISSVRDAFGQSQYRVEWK